MWRKDLKHEEEKGAKQSNLCFLLITFKGTAMEANTSLASGIVLSLIRE